MLINIFQNCRIVGGFNKNGRSVHKYNDSDMQTSYILKLDVDANV